MRPRRSPRPSPLSSLNEAGYTWERALGFPLVVHAESYVQVVQAHLVDGNAVFPPRRKLLLRRVDHIALRGHDDEGEVQCRSGTCANPCPRYGNCTTRRTTSAATTWAWRQPSQSSGPAPLSPLCVPRPSVRYRWSPASEDHTCVPTPAYPRR